MNLKNLLGGLLILGSHFSYPVAIAADAEVKFAPNPDTTMKQVLIERVGKRATIRMGSGEDIAGKVVSVGDKLVHIESVEGRDFYDAVISLDHISAVQIMVRGPSVRKQ